MRGSTAHRLILLAQEAAEAPPLQADDALRQVLERLRSWIGAANAYWVGAVREPQKSRDPLLGWRSRGLLYLSDHERMIPRSEEMVARIHKGEVDPATAAMLRQAGCHRALLRREAVDDHVWNRSWIVREYQRPRGIHDQLVATHALASDRESHIGLVRGSDDRAFGARERDLLLLFVESSRAFHHRTMFFRGLGAVTALTAREREVLRLLASDGTEREIAALLGLGPRTVHQHALSIYRKLGVRGRVGLLSLLAGSTQSRCLAPLVDESHSGLPKSA